MSPENEVKLAYRLAIILLVVGVLSYAAFAVKPPEQPLRKMYKTAAGKVLFDHKTHAEKSGYGISCEVCHHHPESGEYTSACAACHILPADGSAPKACAECHEPDEIEVEAIPTSKDAYHGQCEGCHKEKKAGPQECTACHISQ